MSRAGPEKLCSTKFVITDLLKLMGLYNNETGQVIDEMCELSIAAMDIESQTVTTHMGRPQPGLNLGYAEIDESVLEGHVKKIQKPIMIAHMDALHPSGDCFTVTDDSEEAVFEMMIHYWNYVLKCHIDAIKKKWSLCEPLRKIVLDYKNAFYKYFQDWIIRDFESRSEQMEEALKELDKQMNIAPSSSSSSNSDDDDDDDDDDEEDRHLLRDAVMMMMMRGTDNYFVMQSLIDFPFLKTAQAQAATKTILQIDPIQNCVVALGMQQFPDSWTRP